MRSSDQRRHPEDQSIDLIKESNPFLSEITDVRLNLCLLEYGSNLGISILDSYYKHCQMLVPFEETITNKETIEAVINSIAEQIRNDRVLCQLFATSPLPDDLVIKMMEKLASYINIPTTKQIKNFRGQILATLTPQIRDIEINKTNLPRMVDQFHQQHQREIKRRNKRVKEENKRIQEASEKNKEQRAEKVQEIIDPTEKKIVGFYVEKLAADVNTLTEGSEDIISEEFIANEIVKKQTANALSIYRSHISSWKSRGEKKGTEYVNYEEIVFLDKVKEYSQQLKDLYSNFALKDFIFKAHYYILKLYRNFFDKIKHDPTLCDLFRVAVVPDNQVKYIFNQVLISSGFISLEKNIRDIEKSLPRRGSSGEKDITVHQLSASPEEMISILKSGSDSEKQEAVRFIKEFTAFQLTLLNQQYPHIPLDFQLVSFVNDIQIIVTNNDFWQLQKKTMFGTETPAIVEEVSHLLRNWDMSSYATERACGLIGQIGNKYLDTEEKNEVVRQFTIVCVYGISCYHSKEGDIFHRALDKVKHTIGHTISDPYKQESFIQCVLKIIDEEQFWKNKVKNSLFNYPTGVRKIKEIIEDGRKELISLKKILEKIQKAARIKINNPDEKRDDETMRFYLAISRLSLSDLQQFYQDIKLPILSTSSTNVTSPSVTKASTAAEKKKRQHHFFDVVTNNLLPFAAGLSEFYNTTQLFDIGVFKQAVLEALFKETENKTKKSITRLFELYIFSQLHINKSQIEFLGNNNFNLIIPIQNTKDADKVVMQMMECRVSSYESYRRKKLDFLVPTYPHNIVISLDVDRSFLGQDEFNNPYNRSYQVVLEFKEYLPNVEQWIKRLHIPNSDNKLAQHNREEKHKEKVLQGLLHIAFNLLDIVEELIEKRIIWTDMKLSNLLIKDNCLLVSDTKALLAPEDIILYCNNRENCLATKFDGNWSAEDCAPATIQTLFSYPCGDRDPSDCAQEAREFFFQSWQDEYKYRIGSILLAVLTNMNSSDSLDQLTASSQDEKELIEVIKSLCALEPKNRMSLNEARGKFDTIQERLGSNIDLYGRQNFNFSLFTTHSEHRFATQREARETVEISRDPIPPKVPTTTTTTTSQVRSSNPLNNTSQERSEPGGPKEQTPPQPRK